MIKQEQLDASAVSGFTADLEGMSDDQIETERDEVSDRIDEETAWLEALYAERRIRARNQAT